jgi:hypothetical protein
VSDHPYRNLPDHRLWRKAISGVPASEVDPFVSAPYWIGINDRIVTAGSCFAQHVARYLRNAGLNFLVTETAHPITPPDLAETIWVRLVQRAIREHLYRAATGATIPACVWTVRS